jgi:hypothetical protein
MQISTKTPKNVGINSIKAVVILFALIWLGCSENSNINSTVIFERPAITDSLVYYFPPVLSDTFKSKNPNYQDFKQRWYSSALYAFKLPILYNKTAPQTTYRLLWLRSFHHPVCFSMKEYKDRYYLNARELNKQPAFHNVINGRVNAAGERISDTVQKADRLAFIVFDTTLVLAKSQWTDIEKYLSGIDFWNSPMNDPNGAPDTDGSAWVIEGRQNNKYHFIERYNAAGTLMDFGKYLIKTSGISIPADAVY